MLKDSLISSLYEIGCIQFGEFQLKSGQKTSIYINLRKIISYPPILRMIATAMWQATRTASFDLVCGVPYTALPIATCISLDHDIPMIMRRKEKKDYGTKQLIEGEFKTGQQCLIVEDVITTGGSILETAADLENVGLKIMDVVCLMDREQGGKENLSRKYKVHTILTLSETLKTLINMNALKAEELRAIDKFLDQK